MIAIVLGAIFLFAVIGFWRKTRGAEVPRLWGWVGLVTGMFCFPTGLSIIGPGVHGLNGPLILIFGPFLGGLMGYWITYLFSQKVLLKTKTAIPEEICEQDRLPAALHKDFPTIYSRPFGLRIHWTALFVLFISGVLMPLLLRFWYSELFFINEERFSWILIPSVIFLSYLVVWLFWAVFQRFFQTTS